MDRIPLVESILESTTRKFSTTFNVAYNPKILKDFSKDTAFVSAVVAQIKTNDIFRDREFDSIYQFGVLRNFIYYVVRILQPKIMVETGVHHGLTSAWILKAMSDNQCGKLISIDLPRRDWNKYYPDVKMGEYAEGEFDLQDHDPGWVIPDSLRSRWEIILGPSMLHLDSVFAKNNVDIFIHDSDHSYQNMKDECELALSCCPKALFIVDNFDLNKYVFELLARIDAQYMFVEGTEKDMSVREQTAVCRLRGQ